MSLWTCSTHGLTGPAACCSKSVRCANTGENAVTDAPRQDAPDAENDVLCGVCGLTAYRHRALPGYPSPAERAENCSRDEADVLRAHIGRLRERVPSEPINACPDSCECDGSCEPPALAPHAPEPVHMLDDSSSVVEWPCKCGVTHRVGFRSAAPEPVAFTTGHCESHKQPGGCPLPNVQCGYPECDRRPTPPQRAGVTEVMLIVPWDAERGTPCATEAMYKAARAVVDERNGPEHSAPTAEMLERALAAASRVAPQGGET